MSDTPHHPILNYLRRILGTAADGGIPDAELLRRYVSHRDEAAFELLLWRHAAMVLHVCRRLLREPNAIEDAFQATFLVFVRKAASISRRESLGGWLYRVAYRIALKARQQSTKREAVEHRDSSIDLPDTSTEDVATREVGRIVCEEVERLPARYRTAIVACFFEGKTHEEAAQHLGWPRGTVASRLARGRELMRLRLLRRGIALTATALATVLVASPSSAALTGLIRTTIQTMKLVTAGSPLVAALPPSVATLAEGVLQAMYWTRMKIVMVVLLLAGLGGGGTAFWASPPKAAATPEKSAPPAQADRGGDKERQSDVADKIRHDMAQSRLNLRKLAWALVVYADANKELMPPPALINKDGKAVLSWRVLILPYLGERALYEQFKLSEPWDSPHNKKLLSKMPNVFAPPGMKTAQPFSTFYQVFVSPKRPMVDNPNDQPAEFWISAGFRQGEQFRFPASFPDGTSNTILIVQAGRAVPWTKPEDLPYDNKALPQLGGLFPDVFHAAFADTHVETLTKKYDEYNLRCAITSNDGLVMDFEKIKAQDAAAADRRQNRRLRQNLEDAQQPLRLLREERDVLLGRPVEKRPPNDEKLLEELKKENTRLREESEKVNEEMKSLFQEIQRRLHSPSK
jgi:RNA polymerase sigma factor (sigma-70 family)